MKKRLLPIFLFCLAMCFTACSERHFISDTGYRETVTKDFREKQKALPRGGFFSIFDSTMTVPEREAMMYYIWVYA